MLFVLNLLEQKNKKKGKKMSLDPTLQFIKNLIDLIESNEKDKQVTYNFYRKDLEKYQEKIRTLQAEKEEIITDSVARISKIQDENDALRMELARTKKGFKQSKK